MDVNARMLRLENALVRLGDAQARTEAALARLAEAQARTEMQLARLETQVQERGSRFSAGRRTVNRTEAFARPSSSRRSRSRTAPPSSGSPNSSLFAASKRARWSRRPRVAPSRTCMAVKWP